MQETLDRLSSKRLQLRPMAGTFRSLKGRNFRLYMCGQSISMAGTFMQGVAQAWLVLKITGSGTALGLATLLQYLPMTLLSPACGVIADRVDRRRLLLVTEVLLALEAVGMGALVVTGRVELWMVYVLAGVLGLISALEQPVRSTFLHDLVGTADLSNAVSLNMALNNVSRASGPALAGLIIALPQASWRGLDAGQRSLLAPLRGRIGRISALGERGTRSDGRPSCTYSTYRFPSSRPSSDETRSLE